MVEGLTVEQAGTFSSLAVYFLAQKGLLEEFVTSLAPEDMVTVLSVATVMAGAEVEDIGEMRDAAFDQVAAL
jgi:hypothetical protein